MGLGNPGREHARDRHNAGFMVADALRERWSLPAPSKRFGGVLSEGQIGGPGTSVLIGTSGAIDTLLGSIGYHTELDAGHDAIAHPAAFVTLDAARAAQAQRYA